MEDCTQSKFARLEYKVRPVTRYIITRYAEGPSSDGGNRTASSSTRGEYECADTAYHVAYALCKAEHDELGWPVGDERVQYPRDPRTTQTGSGEDAA